MTDNAPRCARCGNDDPTLGPTCGMCPYCCRTVNGRSGPCRPYEQATK